MDSYKNLTKLKHNSNSETDDRNEALKRAWLVRDFEIELFWKRTTYFSVLVGSLFIALYKTSNGGDDSGLFSQFLISVLGFIASLIWFLSNKGSKFWQENWELHIDQIEKDIGKNKLHSLILYRRSNKLFSLGGDSFSVSKLNTLFSLIVCISWFFILVFTSCYTVIALILLTVALWFGFKKRHLKYKILKIKRYVLSLCKSSFYGYKEGCIESDKEIKYFQKRDK